MAASAPLLGVIDDVELDILLIEDSASDAKLARLRLLDGGFHGRYRIVATEEELRRALEEAPPSLVLSDFHLPGFDGMEALAIVNQQCPDVPFIFLSGAMGEELAIEALHRGAVDYVLKWNPGRLVPAVERALAEARLRRKARQAEGRVTRLNGALQMLSGINTAVVRIHDRSALLSEACRLAHCVGGYPVTMIAMVDTPTRIVRPVANDGLLTWRGRDPPALQIAGSDEADTSIVGRVIRTGEAVFCGNISGSSLPVTGDDTLGAAGIRAIACLPLTIDGTPVGAFLFGSFESDLVSDEETKLLREVAGNLSFALQYLDREDAAHFLAYFDPLTGLAKRALFCERLGRLLVRGANRLPQLAVNVFDIEHLRVINDSLGRHAGDRLLQCVADRLKACYSDTDRLAHLGGGTFASFTALGTDAETQAHLLLLHESAARLFNAPFVIDGTDIAVKVKCGFACYPENGREPNELVQNAEAALKEAKSCGEQYLHHRLDMNSALAERVRMEGRLRAALQNGQFVLHYQPKVELRTGRIVDVEALLRWQDPDRGLVAPASFLPILESVGLMSAVSSWVLHQAVADCQKWRERGLPPVRVAVNIGPAELRRRGFAEEVLSAIGPLREDALWGVDIEVTEGMLFGDASACVHALRMLRSCGMRIAIDDFGTGYSSLGRLSELPIDSLKIDQMFVSGLPADERSCKLVTTIIELARAFGMRTIAEGVATRDQLDFLARSECDESQGFLHSPAVSSTELARLLEHFNTVAST